MNISRRLPNGDFKDEEVLNKSQIYITTAGWKGTFAYEKLIQILIQQIINPDEAIAFGGSWRIPVMEQLLSKNFIRELKLDGTFNESSFDREYRQICTLKILRIVWEALKTRKLQRKYEIKLSVNVKNYGYWVISSRAPKRRRFND